VGDVQIPKPRVKTPARNAGFRYIKFHLLGEGMVVERYMKKVLYYDQKNIIEKRINVGEDEN